MSALAALDPVGQNRGVTPLRCGLLVGWVSCLAIGAWGCHTPDPAKELALSEVETYWAIDSSVGEAVYLCPVVRFRVASTSASQAIQATATFRRQGESVTWGSAWEQVSSGRRPLATGASTTVVLKSDGRYYSTGTPESMFKHALFKDAHVEVFLRVGGSGWVKLIDTDIERRIGAHSVQDLGGH